MSWLRKLERRFGRYAIPNLTLYLVGGQGLALLMSLGAPGVVQEMLLFPAAVLAGEWWRVLSFLFMPPNSNVLFAAFALYLLYIMGGALEAQWGSFRYNVYVLIGYVLTVLAAFVFPWGLATNAYLTSSIFLAFAYLFPDFTLMLFFVLPVKVKWLALLTWLYYGYSMLTGDWSDRALIFAAIANFLLFFGSDLYATARYGQRKMQQQARRMTDKPRPMNVCSVCGANNLTHPTTDFRYCSKCDPPVAYCMDHLDSHTHCREEPPQEV